MAAHPLLKKIVMPRVNSTIESAWHSGTRKRGSNSERISECSHLATVQLQFLATPSEPFRRADVFLQQRGFNLVSSRVKAHTLETAYRFSRIVCMASSICLMRSS